MAQESFDAPQQVDNPRRGKAGAVKRARILQFPKPAGGTGSRVPQAIPAVRAKWLIAEAVRGGVSFPLAAKHAGIDDEAAFVWAQQDPEFAARLRKAAEDYRTEVEERWHGLVRKSAESLQAMLDAPESKVPLSAKLKAAFALVRLSDRFERETRRLAQPGTQRRKPDSPDAA